MITVHHLENSRSQRVIWLLEELHAPYEIRRYQRDGKTKLAPPELKAVHPLGKSPVITDGDITVAETGAIFEYLLDTYDAKGVLRPAAGTPARRRFTYWLHYAEGSAMPPLLLALVFSQVARAPMPFFIRPVARAIADGAMKSFIGPQLALHLDYMDAELAAAPWFAGKSFSAADIQMSFPLEAAAARGDLARGRSHLEKFLEKIHDRPAYKRALDAGGPYDMKF
jgi:glutathione S-transferase